MNSPATWAFHPADASTGTAHLYTGTASRCGHASRPRAAVAPAPVGPSAPRCPRCLRYARPA